MRTIGLTFPQVAKPPKPPAKTPAKGETTTKKNSK